MRPGNVKRTCHGGGHGEGSTCKVLGNGRISMKAVFVAFAVLFFCLVCLTGCSSVQSLIKSGMTGLPFWVYSPNTGVGRGRTAFVGEGRSSSSRQAELLAYSSIVEQLSDYLGVELGQEVYRELSVLGTVQEYGLSIGDAFSRTEDRETVFYVYVVADLELLEAASSDETLRRNETSRHVEELVLQGDSYMKDEMFTKGVSCYMQAMLLAYGQDYIDEEYSYEVLCQDIVDILDSLTVSVPSSDPTQARCTVAVSRKSVLFPAKVKNAGVVAYYSAVDMKGDVYDDSFVYVTGNDGSFVFDCLNFTMARAGSVVFVLDFESELKALEASTDPDASARLRNAVQEKSVVFEYDRAYGLGSIAVAAIEFDSKGYPIGSKSTTDYLCSKFNADSADSSPFYTSSSFEDDVLYDYQHLKGGADCLLVCRFGQVGSTESRLGTYAVGVEGTAALFNVETGNEIYSSSVVYATAFGDSLDAATKAAYEKIADIVYSLLKAVYV